MTWWDNMQYVTLRCEVCDRLTDVMLWDDNDEDWCCRHCGCYAVHDTADEEQAEFDFKISVQAQPNK